MADSLNDYTRDLLDKATASGWDVLEVNVRLPGYILLMDSRGFTVELRSEHGLDLPYYVEHLKARPRDSK